MKTNTIAAILTVAFVGLPTFGSAAQAQSLRHIDELAAAAQWQARRVLFDTYHLPGYGPRVQELKNDALQMARLARHIHVLAHTNVGHRYGHNHGRRLFSNRMIHIKRDVEQLDQLMHHMQDSVAEMKAKTIARRRTAGAFNSPNIGFNVGRRFSVNFGGSFHRGFGSYGHRGGYSTVLPILNRMQSNLARLEATVHHLIDDTQAVCYRMR